jgi:N-methylhydantoinase B/oxoprolinase/acetone carboxylase alpha subunit
VTAEELYAAIQALPEPEREEAHAAVRDELARRRRVRRVEALDGAADVAALVDLARLLAADADDRGRCELLHSVADRAEAAVEAMRAALAETPSEAAQGEKHFQEGG